MAESLTSARERNSSDGAKLRSSFRRASISGETFSDMNWEYIFSGSGVQGFKGSRVQVLGKGLCNETFNCPRGGRFAWLGPDRRARSARVDGRRMARGRGADR